MAAAHFFSRIYDRRFVPTAQKTFGADRHGDDREPGRLGSARQRYPRRALRERRRAGASTGSTGTSGSCRRQCATRFWCWPRRGAGRRASWFRGGPRRARETPFTSAVSRTSSATARTRRARSNSKARTPNYWVKKAAEFRRSSKWATTRGSIAPSDRLRSCGRPWRRPFIMPGTAGLFRSGSSSTR